MQKVKTKNNNNYHKFHINVIFLTQQTALNLSMQRITSS